MYGTTLSTVNEFTHGRYLRLVTINGRAHTKQTARKYLNNSCLVKRTIDHGF